jgi:hypothetical protein
MSQIGSTARDPSGRGPIRRPPIKTHYGRFVAVIAVIAVAGFTLNTALSKPKGAGGIAVGERVPPFAAPLALGGLSGDVDVATYVNEGQAGKVAACRERGAGILNVCQLYEKGPLVLALIVDSGSCPAVLADMQKLVSSFPQVSFAAVALKGDSHSVGRLVQSEHLTFPVALDRDGILAGLYKISTCPQLTFAYPGGTVQSRALLERPSLGVLRRRVGALVGGSRARGWRPARS